MICLVELTFKGSQDERHGLQFSGEERHWTGLVEKNSKTRLLFASKAPPQEEAPPLESDERKSWELLIVDDDESVLTVTQLALRKFQVDGRGMRLYTARSRQEAETFLKEHGKVAVMITDVVMESDAAGLELVSWVRSQEAFDAMRLVVRTGQAGLAPEEQILGELNINDYWPKTDIGAHRMRTILTGLIRSFSDINLIHAQKKTLEEMQAALFEHERTKALSALASGVTHDVNNALTPITAYASMLVDIDDLTNDERKEYAEIILQASQDAARVVKRLKGSYANDGSDPESSETCLQSLLLDAAALARPKVAMQETVHDIKIELSVPEATERMIQCNAAEIRQAILNLIINAVDAITENGSITVRSEHTDTHLDIVIDDTGSGMQPDVLNRCRRAFYTTKGSEGTGLGLPMVEQTLKAHGGSLHIESQLGRGTSVRLRMPNSTTILK